MGGGGICGSVLYEYHSTSGIMGTPDEVRLTNDDGDEDLVEVSRIKNFAAHKWDKRC